MLVITLKKYNPTRPEGIGLQKVAVPESSTPVIAMRLRPKRSMLAPMKNWDATVATSPTVPRLPRTLAASASSIP